MAIKHNNVIPNVHFRKWWQRYVTTWFNQAGRKKSRRVARQKKAAAAFPAPASGLLRPAVHPATQRYNYKVKFGFVSFGIIRSFEKNVGRMHCAPGGLFRCNN